MKKLAILNADLVLASASPRRKYLLESAGFKVTVYPSSIDETYSSALAIRAIPSYLASKKAHAVKPQITGDPIIVGADTIVVLENEVIGKPEDAVVAASMLQRLSGKSHWVYTGVCLLNATRKMTFSTRSQVTFAELSKEEIDFYIERFRPFDKAGSYGIQEWIGWCKIRKINGSYSNIMGLPMERFYSKLSAFLN